LATGIAGKLLELPFLGRPGKGQDSARRGWKAGRESGNEKRYIHNWL